MFQSIVRPLAAVFFLSYSISSLAQYNFTPPILNVQIDHNITVELTDQHYSEHNGAVHSYYQQYYLNRPITNGRFNITYHQKDTIAQLDNVIKDLTKFTIIKPQKTNLQHLVESVSNYLKIPFTKASFQVQEFEQGLFKISNLIYSRSEVQAQESWTVIGNELRPTITFEIPSSLSPDYWIITIDRNTAEIIEEANQTVYCSFKNHQSKTRQIDSHKLKQNQLQTSIDNPVNSQYRVFAYPTESPSHGERTLVINPADPIASPYGWHDLDENPASFNTITRGNNVRAYKDEDDNDEPDGNIPDGGSQLIFDFPFQPDSSLQFNLNTDITNLFYWNNFLHDWTYKFGFNEAAGNFQYNNYNKGGSPEDHVEAQTLDGGDTGNANFSAPRDGITGRMQMYRWLGGSAIDILADGDISNYNAGSANFGPLLKSEIDGRIVIVDDGIGEPTDACDPITNGNALNGNVALIDRGTCHFSAKVYAAQQKGAAACIICNNIVDGGLVSMSPGDNANQVTIPSVFLTKEDCDNIKLLLNEGKNPQVKFYPVTEISSSFDNGIVAHEYGHGVSLRLVGGSSSSGCLNNDEQMGEGWSDFIAMIMTQEADDDRFKTRSIGSYALGEEIGGRGIRRHRYSTDMNVNKQTLSHIRATNRPHPLGEIWASVLWDIYWDMIDQYGYDPTWKNRESGNFKTVQIVIDGMKIQGCNVGLLDARDALFSADLINYSGENTCLLWHAFARRGMGVDAVQGNKDSRRDNIDGFEVSPSCKNSFEIKSRIPEYVHKSDTISLSISIDNLSKENYNEALLNLEIPTALEIIDRPTNSQLTGDNIFTLPIGNLNTSSILDLSLKAVVRSQPAAGLIFENFEETPEFIFESSQSTNWALKTNAENTKVALASGTPEKGEAILIYPNPIAITNTSNLLKFDHQFDSELGQDGGLIQISTDNGNTWLDIRKDQFLANSYNDNLTFDILYNETKAAFTGKRSWQTSLIDLSEYMDKSIKIRFNYTKQLLEEMTEYEGWQIDNIEVLEKLPLSIPGKVSSENQPEIQFEFSTHVGTKGFSTPTLDIPSIEDYFTLVPSPASEMITMIWQSDKTLKSIISIFNAQGQLIRAINSLTKSGKNELTISITDLDAGTYFLKIENSNFQSIKPFIKI